MEVSGFIKVPDLFAMELSVVHARSIAGLCTAGQASSGTLAGLHLSLPQPRVCHCERSKAISYAEKKKSQSDPGFLPIRDLVDRFALLAIIFFGRP